MFAIPIASDRVRGEWRRRIEAEYRSAAITQHLTLWLIQIGAAPDLIEDGLRIVADELAHAALSHEVFTAAAGRGGPNIDRAALALTPHPDQPLERDVLRSGVQVFCLGETVAVPLFAHLRAGCDVAPARAALDRVLRDEVRHRDFGWSLLDWMLESPLRGQAVAQIEAELPDMFAELERSYGDAGRDGGGGDGGAGNDERGDGDGGRVTADDRRWGLAPATEYAGILRATYNREYAPRFRARGIDPQPAWDARRG